MQSSSPELVDEAPVEDEPAPTPLIMIETSDDSGVCAVDGWCD